MIWTVFTASMAACGGASQPLNVDGTGTDGTSTPAATTASQGDQAATGSQEIYVPPSQFKDFNLSLNGGDAVRLHFVARSQVVGRSALGTGGSQQGQVESEVTLAVTDPLGNVIYEGKPTKEDTVNFTAESAGKYTFTFINSFPFQGESVKLDYVINP
ncbi:MAG: emp24/gp25L/p24 family protein [SAR202 cluster bacterium]|nr:emp24/gp25L/p24 family protein [SAR202 cluster bacterium]